MSLIIVPDDVLDKLVCDFCHKYLSVKPVTVSSNKRVTCGRCVSKTSNDLVESIYKSFAESALFKCINRYDGCNVLLKYNEVQKHETNCTVNRYLCPLCKNSTDVSSAMHPTHSLTHHIPDKHRISYLKQNSVVVNLTNEIRNLFFYKQGNFLFFIWMEFNKATHTLSLNASFIGGTGLLTEVFQKYCLKTSETYYTTFKGMCLKQSLSNDINYTDNKLEVELSSEVEMVIVEFEFETPIIANTISNIDVPQTKQVEQKAQPIGSYQLLINEEISRSKRCFSGRNLRYVGTKPLPNWIVINHCQIKLIVFGGDGPVTICFHCILCKMVPCRQNFNDILLTERSESLSHIVCGACKNYVLTNLVKLCSVLPKYVFDGIQYSCINSSCNGSYEYLSENFFRKHKCIRSIHCCFQHCHPVLLYSLKEHFDQVHNTTILHINVEDCWYRLNLPPNKSITRFFFVKEVFIKVLVMKRSYNDDYLLIPQICDPNTGNLNLIMPVFDLHENLIGTFVKDQIVVNSKYPWVNLYFIII